jgi:hypothetical protein
MDGLRPDSPSARAFAQALGDASFMLVDIGCSGGLDAGWRVFGDRLAAYGFDPSQFEIDRLTAAETNPGVRYVNGFVALPDGHPAKGANGESWRTDPWRRVSAYRTQTLQRARETGRPKPPPFAQPLYEPLPPRARRAAATPHPAAGADQQDLMSRNLWSEAQLAEDEIDAAAYLAAQGVVDMDFVKIDVDGTDFEVLQSLDTALNAAGVLGVSIEVGYSGTGDPDDNSFHNIDRYLRQRGFDLMDLTVRRYGLHALPFPFAYRRPLAAQTSGGRPLIGDALYLRDFGHGCKLDPAAWSDAKLVKLGALYCLFGLLDHAAELLNLFGDRLARSLDVAALREQLTSEIQDLSPAPHDGRRFAAYADYLAAYEDDDLAFYGAAERAGEQRDAAALQQAVALAEARAALARAEAAAAEAVAQREALVRTLSWRLTKPLRALRALGSKR